MKRLVRRWNTPINAPQRRNAGLVSNENGRRTWVGWPGEKGPSALPMACCRNCRPRRRPGAPRLGVSATGSAVRALWARRCRTSADECRKYMATTALNPLTIAKGIAGGGNRARDLGHSTKPCFRRHRRPAQEPGENLDQRDGHRQHALPVFARNSRCAVFRPVETGVRGGKPPCRLSHRLHAGRAGFGPEPAITKSRTG